MISPEYCQMMARYNAWQNAGLREMLKHIPTADLTKDRGGVFWFDPGDAEPSALGGYRLDQQAGWRTRHRCGDEGRPCHDTHRRCLVG